jgi:hypothetical protein
MTVLIVHCVAWMQEFVEARTQAALAKSPKCRYQQVRSHERFSGPNGGRWGQEILGPNCGRNCWCLVLPLKQPSPERQRTCSMPLGYAR